MQVAKLLLLNTLISYRGDIFVSTRRSFTLKAANFRLHEFAAGFSTFERELGQTGMAPSRDNVLSPDERC